MNLAATPSRAAFLATLVACLLLAACAGRGGQSTGGARHAAPPPAETAPENEPLTPGIVPLTVEQERDAI